MRIGMILERDFPTTPPDIRVLKEIRALTNGGHSVALLGLQSTSTLRVETLDGLKIRRAPIAMLCIKEWTAAKVQAHFHSPASPWVAAIGRFIVDENLDALHVHDLPLAWTTAHAAARCGKAVVFDMHEVYPDLVACMRPPPPGQRNAGAWDPSRWTADYEAECLQLADQVVVTVRESKERLVARGIPADKVAVVMNTEAVTAMRPRTPPPPGLATLRHKFVVAYVGAFGAVRGLDLLIRATAMLAESLPEIHLLLVGGGYNQPELEALTRDLGLRQHVTITGWVPFEAVPAYIDAAHVCAVPHRKNAFTDTTIPHKLFQYMLRAKPVVVSDAAPLRRIVTAAACGRVFCDGDVAGLAGRIKALADAPAERRQLGLNGQNAAYRRYNWDMESRNLLKLYRKIALRNS